MAIRAAAAVGSVLLITLPTYVESFWLSVAIQTMIFGLLALSVAFLVGHVGLLPLGHAALFGSAAYGAAYFQVELGGSPWLAMLVGFLSGMVVTLLFSFSVRARGVYFLLVTLALGMSAWGLANRWTSVTRGENGIPGVFPPVVFGIDFSSLDAYYYVVLAVVGLCLAAYSRIVRAPMGLTLRGIRDSESRMETLGYNVALHKWTAWMLSGAFASVAGVLYVYWNKFVSPGTLVLLRSAEAKLMAILGGPETLAGPWVGAWIIVFIRNYVSGELDRYLTLMGLVFVLTAIFFPKGIFARFRTRALRATARPPRISTPVLSEPEAPVAHER